MHTERFEMPLNMPTGGAARSRGVHVSSLIKGLAVETGILKIQDRLEELKLVDANQELWWATLDHASRLKISIGLAWEQWYLGQLQDTIVDHPGELCVDGIYLTSDGESLDLVASERPGISRYVMAIHEVKATYKSVNTVIDWASPKNWMWKTQIQAYCKARDTTLGWAHVLHLAGDYGYPINPHGYIYRLQFTDREINESWDKLTEYRDYRLSLEAEEAMKDTYDAVAPKATPRLVR